MNKNSLKRFLIFSCLAIGFVYALLFYKQTFVGFGFTIFYSVIVATILIAKVIKYGEFKFSIVETIYIPLFLLSLVPTFTQNATIVFFSTFLTYLGLHLFTIYSIWEIGINDFNFFNIFTIEITHLVGQFIGLSNLFKGFYINKQKNPITFMISSLASKVILGIIISIPLLLIYLVLFLSSDDLFSKWFSNFSFDKIFNFISGDGIGFIILAVIIFVISLLFFCGYFLFNKDKGGFKIISLKPLIDSVVLLTVSVVINLLFFIFIITQFIYLFGDRQTTINLGIVYSEYARRGFFEMLIIGMFSVLVIFVIKSNISGSRKKILMMLNISLLINSFFNIIVLFSAIQRLNLYTSGYGLSEERFFVYCIIFFFMTIFIFFIITLVTDILKLFISNNSHSLISHTALISFVLLVLFTIGIGFINPDRIIAKVNIDRFLTSNPYYNSPYLLINPDLIDVNYLINLSSDSYLQLLDLKSIVLTKDQLCTIGYRWLIEDKNRDNLSTFNIYRTLNKENTDKYLLSNGYIQKEEFTNKMAIGPKCNSFFKVGIDIPKSLDNIDYNRSY